MLLSLGSVRGNCRFLHQGLELLDRLPAEVYRNTSRPGWAPVGSQFRHVLDHYRGFLLGRSSGCIDYDARPRDRRIETDPAEAAGVMASILESLEQIQVHEADHQVTIKMDSGGDSGVPDWSASTIGRELQFLSSHTVHHYALIKVLLEDAGVGTSADFGVAPSSLAHERGVLEAHR
ncbi:MAG: DinB family protein [Gemmatimonadota bacterium]